MEHKPRPMSVAVTHNPCLACGKTVYEMDKIKG